ncbi:MAG TPA: hypothetical protein VFI90_10530 [Rubrobacter sp.]|nr:hypothetical protein [Rubrobacter sp.]
MLPQVVVQGEPGYGFRIGERLFGRDGPYLDTTYGYPHRPGRRSFRNPARSDGLRRAALTTRDGHIRSLGYRPARCPRRTFRLRATRRRVRMPPRINFRRGGFRRLRVLLQPDRIREGMIGGRWSFSDGSCPNRSFPDGTFPSIRDRVIVGRNRLRPHVRRSRFASPRRRGESDFASEVAFATPGLRFI